MATSGILNVDKPAGWTSFDVVGFVRRRCGERRVGHAGTLDPAATGVLPVLIGQATRLTEYLVDATKEYHARIELGLTTDTYDAGGEVVSRTDASAVNRDAIEGALAAFCGDFMQTPPAYSAIKRQGAPLYRLARRGELVVPEPRPVTVEQLDISAFEPPFIDVHVVCRKGFYVRSLAHDLGSALGVGGSLAALQRRRVGSFRIEEAVDIDALRLELEGEEWRERLWAPDEVLLEWRAAILATESEENLRHGRLASLDWDGTPALAEVGLCRAYNGEGDFIGIARIEEGCRLRPEKMFAQ